MFPEREVFREFAVNLPISGKNALERMDEMGVLGGFDLGRWWKSAENSILIGCDERTSDDDIRMLTDCLRVVIEEVAV